MRRESRIEVGGFELRAVEAGHGPAVVVLHGFTGDAESMESVSKGLEDSHRVVRLELVGHGGSDSPASLECYAMLDCARQIVAAIDGLNLERPHLLGYSMGGRAALSTAVRYPDRISSLVLVGATAGIAEANARAARVASDEALARRIEEIGLARFVDEWMALPLFASQARLGADALRRAREQRMRCDPVGLAMSLRGMGAGAQPPLLDELGKISIPTLLVVGDEDEKFEAISKELAEGLPDARRVILEKAGHAAHLEAPEAFAAHVIAFLADPLHRNPAHEGHFDRVDADPPTGTGEHA